LVTLSAPHLRRYQSLLERMVWEQCEIPVVRSSRASRRPRQVSAVSIHNVSLHRARNFSVVTRDERFVRRRRACTFANRFRRGRPCH